VSHLALRGAPDRGSHRLGRQGASITGRMAFRGLSQCRARQLEVEWRRRLTPAFLISQPETIIVSIDAFNVAIEISTDFAVKRANFCTTFVDGESEVRVRGAHLWTLRKNLETGEWQVTSVAWTIEDGNS